MPTNNHHNSDRDHAFEFSTWKDIKKTLNYNLSVIAEIFKDMRNAIYKIQAEFKDNYILSLYTSLHGNNYYRDSLVAHGLWLSSSVASSYLFPPSNRTLLGSGALNLINFGYSLLIISLIQENFIHENTNYSQNKKNDSFALREKVDMVLNLKRNVKNKLATQLKLSINPLLLYCFSLIFSSLGNQLNDTFLSKFLYLLEKSLLFVSLAYPIFYSKLYSTGLYTPQEMLKQLDKMLIPSIIMGAMLHITFEAVNYTGSIAAILQSLIYVSVLMSVVNLKNNDYMSFNYFNSHLASTLFNLTQWTSCKAKDGAFFLKEKIDLPIDLSIIKSYLPNFLQRNNKDGNTMVIMNNLLEKLPLEKLNVNNPLSHFISLTAKDINAERLENVMKCIPVGLTAVLISWTKLLNSNQARNTLKLTNTLLHKGVMIHKKSQKEIHDTKKREQEKPHLLTDEDSKGYPSNDLELREVENGYMYLQQKNPSTEKQEKKISKSYWNPLTSFYNQVISSVTNTSVTSIEP